VRVLHPCFGTVTYLYTFVKKYLAFILAELSRSNYFPLFFPLFPLFCHYLFDIPEYCGNIILGEPISNNSAMLAP